MCFLSIHLRGPGTATRSSNDESTGNIRFLAGIGIFLAPVSSPLALPYRWFALGVGFGCRFLLEAVASYPIVGPHYLLVLDVVFGGFFLPYPIVGWP